MGERLYVVTFRQIDPLFVIDVSNVNAPVLLGELKIPGYSDYLHPINGTHLLGIGKEATLEGRVQGMKLALFDASVPTKPIESYTLTLGDRQTHSAALDDHKAFSYAPCHNLPSPCMSMCSCMCMLICSRLARACAPAVHAHVHVLLPCMPMCYV